MFIRVKQGNILEQPVDLDNTRFVVAYSTEGGSPLFAIMEHGGAVSLMTPEDKGFEETLRIAGL